MKSNCLVLLLLIASCSISKKSNIEEINEYLEEQIQEFKIVFFQDCVSTSYKKDEWGDIDLSYSHDFGLGLPNYKLIDSLVEIIDQKIFVDSLEWTNHMCKGGCDEGTLKRMRDNGMIGKRTLKFCLDYYTSNELDSIARANVKEHKW